MPEEQIPYHIESIGKLYSCEPGLKNLALAQLSKNSREYSIHQNIKKFEVSPNISDVIAVGKRIYSEETIEDEDFSATWVHLGLNYFKLIGLYQAKYV